jgi:uncharacterized protein
VSTPSPNTLLRPNVLAWVAPMAAFMLVLALRGWMGAPPNAAGASDGSSASLLTDSRWIYGLQALAAAALLAVGWKRYEELRSRQLAPNATEWLLAVGVGLAVFVAWINLDAPWMTIGEPAVGFVPLGANGQPDVALVTMRIAGAVLVVPLMEELFWRSFLARWVDDPSFERVDPRRLSVKALVLSTFVFVLAHTLWLAAALAGLAYALLYRHTGKLWVAVIAHAVTNLALAVWVLRTGQWQFW